MQKNPLYTLDQLSNLRERTGFSVNKVLKHHAYVNKPLSFDDAYLLGVLTLSAYKPQLDGLFPENAALAERQSIAALCALHNKETYRHPAAAEQIAGICAAVFDYDIRTSPKGFIEPQRTVIDNCGMGGDLYRTPNVSTLAGIIAAAGGTALAKHGSPGNTDSTGSSDFLAHCGVELFPSRELVEKALDTIGFAYTDALDEGYKTIHVQTHKSAHLAHMNDIIGPITNPITPEKMSHRIVGINHLLLPRVVAEAYNILNERGVTKVERALFVRGFIDREMNGGMDELSTLPGGSIVAELDRGTIEEYRLVAADFGLPVGSYRAICPPEGKVEKAAFSKDILEGRIKGDARDLILANAAAIDYVVNRRALPEGVERARELLESGAAKRLLERLALKEVAL